MDFRAGQIFAQPKVWDRSVELLRSNGILLKQCVLDAIKNRAVDLVHPAFFNKSKSPIIFNGQKFKDLDDVSDSYFGNYAVINQNKGRVRSEIENFIRLGAISEVQQVDDSYCVNPLSAVISGEKCRLLLHFKGNDAYVKGGLKLQTMPMVKDRLYEMEQAEVNDLTKAYLQFPLLEGSRKLSAFEFEGKFFVFNVLSFGPSMAPEICQSLLQVPVMVARLKTQPKMVVLVMHWLDDFLEDISKNQNSQVLQSLIEHNVRINPAKRQIGSIVVYLGLLLNLKQKTVELKPELKEEFQQKIQTVMRQPTLENLESLAGSLEFWAGMDPWKRSKSFFLVREINARLEEELAEPRALSEDLIRELNFWAWEGLKPIKMPTPEPWLFATVQASSDASSERWAVKIEGKTVSGPFPEELKQEIIFVKEFYRQGFSGRSGIPLVHFGFLSLARLVG